MINSLKCGAPTCGNFTTTIILMQKAEKGCINFGDEHEAGGLEDDGLQAETCGVF